MGKLISLVTPLHKKTNRDYLGRMMDDKARCMVKAKKFAFDFWDGERKFGYGGYTYDGRWKVVAQKLIKRYHLTNKSRILDVGCGKAHLLYELKKLLPRADIVGTDISSYAIKHAPLEIRNNLRLLQAQDRYPWKNNYFDLVISLATLHNLKIHQLQKALAEIQRVGKKKYIMVESFRNELELFNLECWALTALAFFDVSQWQWLFKHFGFTGDYEFIYFE